jgi:hypothetical protein
MINNEISDYVKEAEKNEKRRENLIEEIDPVLKKKRAENEKNKGNEAMKSNVIYNLIFLGSQRGTSIL